MLQARTLKGQPIYDVVQHRHGKKYFAKVVKEAKDQSWRDMAVLYTIRSIESGTRPKLELPTLAGVKSVKPSVQKPEKRDVVNFHQSRLLKKYEQL